MSEPWMRGTHGELDVVRRGVMHALELAEEDVARSAAALSDAEMFARLASVAPVAFHLRHMVRSLDRLLTYAEGGELDARQFSLLESEDDPGTRDAVMAEFTEVMRRAKERVLAFRTEQYEEARSIGRKKLPTTVGGLLIHCAEHTQRHAGQMATTAKVVAGLGSWEPDVA